MKRKWKRLSSMCLAAMLVLMMPISTMMAAEENVETAGDMQDSAVVENQDTPKVVEQDDVQDDSVAEDSEPVSEQPLEDISLIPDENPLPSDENPLFSEQISLIPEDSVTTEPQTEPIFTTSDYDSTPVVELKYQWMHLGQSLDVAIEYGLYINSCGQCVSISVTQVSLSALSYYLDNSGSSESMSEEQLASLWQSADNLSNQQVKLSQDGKYVLYVKAVADNGQAVCIRTIGLVVDSVAPVITGIQNGGTYPLGTKFGVEDANLAAVYVNEQQVSPSDDGQYQVAANGTSCVIRVKDMAGHETIYSITIGEEKPDEPENPDNPNNPDNPDNPNNPDNPDNPNNPDNPDNPDDPNNPDNPDNPNNPDNPDNPDNPNNPDNPDNPDDPKPGDDITVINNSGTYSLHAGTAYRLDSGSWTLQGDSVVYRGSITFYVNTDGDYIFKKR